MSTSAESPSEEPFDLDVTPPDFLLRAQKICDELAELEKLALDAAGLPAGIRDLAVISRKWPSARLR